MGRVLSGWWEVPLGSAFQGKPCRRGHCRCPSPKGPPPTCAVVLWGHLGKEPGEACRLRGCTKCRLPARKLTDGSHLVSGAEYPDALSRAIVPAPHQQVLLPLHHGRGNGLRGACSNSPRIPEPGTSYPSGLTARPGCHPSFLLPLGAWALSLPEPQSPPLKQEEAHSHLLAHRCKDQVPRSTDAATGVEEGKARQCSQELLALSSG